MCSPMFFYGVPIIPVCLAGPEVVYCGSSDPLSWCSSIQRASELGNEVTSQKVPLLVGRFITVSISRIIQCENGDFMLSSGAALQELRWLAWVPAPCPSVRTSVLPLKETGQAVSPSVIFFALKSSYLGRNAAGQWVFLSLLFSVSISGGRESRKSGSGGARYSGLRFLTVTVWSGSWSPLMFLSLILYSSVLWGIPNRCPARWTVIWPKIEPSTHKIRGYHPLPYTSLTFLQKVYSYVEKRCFFP